MALGSALVDRARRIRVEPTPQRVEGATQFTPQYGAWFRARVSLAAAPEVEDQQGSHKRTVRRPTLLYGTRDSEGGGITLDTISADDLVEVDSREFGRVTFRVTGDAEPLRRRRSLIGFEIALARVDEEAFTAAVS